MAQESRVSGPLSRALRAVEVDEKNLAMLAGIVAGSARRKDVVTLTGDLGMGKTSFARGFIRARAGDAIEVPSPTFTLVQVYEIGDTPVWHFDLYRVTEPGELVELGFEEALGSAIALIEWPERIMGALPPDRLEIAIEPGSRAQSRMVDFVGRGDWAGRLESLARAIAREAGR